MSMNRTAPPQGWTDGGVEVGNMRLQKYMRIAKERKKELKNWIPFRPSKEINGILHFGCVYMCICALLWV